MNVEMSRVSVRCIKTTSVTMKVAPVIRAASKPNALRPTLQPRGNLFVSSANLFSSITSEQKRAIHCSTTANTTKESESVTKDLQGKDAPKPYNEGHGSASTEEIVDTEAAFDSDTVDPKEEMKEAEDKLDVSGANEKASPTPGNDD
jgi:hypothetical protein